MILVFTPPLTLSYHPRIPHRMWGCATLQFVGWRTQLSVLIIVFSRKNLTIIWVAHPPRPPKRGGLL